MHPKFAERIADIVQAKKIAHGPIAVSEWWEFHFGHLPGVYFRQVMDVLKARKNAF